MADSNTLTPRAPAAAFSTDPRHRPWLLPSNRKLRNLDSISLRNVSLGTTTTTDAASPQQQRHRAGSSGGVRGTTDDDALLQSHHSPAKLVALREEQKSSLGHSRSSTDLRTLAEDAVLVGDEEDSAARANGSPRSSKRSATRPYSTASASPRRPEIRRMRRRSTLEWGSSSSPAKRQQRWEEVMQDRLADMFFSLHVSGVEEPVYVSEVVPQTMNPTFRNIDWAGCGPGITRSCQLTMRVWVRGGRSRSWWQLLQVNIDLRGLQFLSRGLESLHRRLPKNSVLLHLTDGVYLATTAVADLIPQAPAQSTSRPSTAGSQRRLAATSAFDALLRLSRLDDSIQDALATRDKLANDLEALLQENQEALVQRDQVVEAEDRLKTIEFANMTVRKQLDKAQRQKEEKQASIRRRRLLMEQDQKKRLERETEIETTEFDFDRLRTERDQRQTAIQNQRRRICEELQLCYPIEPQPGKALAFTIRDLPLPNSEDLDSQPPETTAAALGAVAHVLQLLSFYLQHPLAYPVSPRGSTSTIYDPISLLKTTASSSSTSASPNPAHLTAAELKLRTYPLFSRSVPRFRFEYGVFLLNQNLRVLLDDAFGVRVLDLRQTLPNLKHLLYLATAGEGELPARKAGGVRGLLMRRGGPGAGERSGSVDSTSSRLSGLTLAGLGFVTGGGGGGAQNGQAQKAKSAAERLREIEAGGR